MSEPDRDPVLARVKAVMIDIGLAPEDVHPEAHLVDDLDLDSLDWVDLALQIEEVLPVAVREERFGSLRTVGDLVDLVRSRLAASVAAGE